MVPAPDPNYPPPVEGEVSVSVEHVDSSSVVVHVRGDVGLAMRDAILTEVKRCPDRLVIDLNEVGFLGSVGLGILVEALRLRPELQLACSKRWVLRILEVTGLQELFAVRATAAEALAAHPQPS